jgi:hypothetical protein
MVDGTRDPVGQAAERLEAAVDALARVLTHHSSATDAPEDMVPRAEVAAIADRLDATLARLRTAIAEELRRDEDAAEA